MVKRGVRALYLYPTLYPQPAKALHRWLYSIERSRSLQVFV